MPVLNQEILINPELSHACPILHNNAFWKTLKYHVFNNIMENGAFAQKEQMLHFPLYFKSVQNFT